MKNIKVILVIVAAMGFLLNGPVRAQRGYDSFHDFKPRSANTAKRYSLWGTLLPVTAGIMWAKLDNSGKETYDPTTGTYVRSGDSGEKTATIFMLSGVIIGPSLGYYYGGCPGKGTKGIAIRIGIGAATGLLAASIANSYESKGWGDVGGAALALAVIGIGGGIIIYDAIIDIGHVKYHVEQNNMKRSLQAGCEISLVPQYFADSDAGGLQLNVTF